MYVNDGESAYVYNQLFVHTSLASVAVFWHVWEEANKQCIYIFKAVISTTFMLSGANIVCIVCAEFQHLALLHATVLKNMRLVF